MEKCLKLLKTPDTFNLALSGMVSEGPTNAAGMLTLLTTPQSCSLSLNTILTIPVQTMTG